MFHFPSMIKIFVSDPYGLCNCLPLAYHCKSPQAYISLLIFYLVHKQHFVSSEEALKCIGKIHSQVKPEFHLNTLLYLYVPISDFQIPFSLLYFINSYFCSSTPLRQSVNVYHFHLEKARSWCLFSTICVSRKLNPFTARMLGGVCKMTLTFRSGRNPMMWPFKWKLSARTVTWCYVFFKFLQNEIGKLGRNFSLSTFGSERLKRTNVKI